jgi:hypothetical protein
VYQRDCSDPGATSQARVVAGPIDDRPLERALVRRHDAARQDAADVRMFLIDAADADVSARQAVHRQRIVRVRGIDRAMPLEADQPAAAPAKRSSLLDDRRTAAIGGDHRSSTEHERRFVRRIRSRNETNGFPLLDQHVAHAIAEPQLGARRDGTLDEQFVEPVAADVGRRMFDRRWNRDFDPFSIRPVDAERSHAARAGPNFLLDSQAVEDRPGGWPHELAADLLPRERRDVDQRHAPAALRQHDR